MRLQGGESVRIMPDRPCVKTETIIEGRRLTFEGFLWQIPAISFSGQAFLLNLVLARNTTGLGRLVASLFGFLAAFAVLQSFLRHRWTEEIHSEWLNSREQGTPRWVKALAEQSAFRVWRRVLAFFVVADALLVVLAVLQTAHIWAPLVSS
jgi:hypothetical protein